MAGLFAVFSATPRVLLEQFGLSPVTLGLMFAGVVMLVFGASMLAPGLSARLGLYRAMLIGLRFTSIGAIALLFAVLAVYWRRIFDPDRRPSLTPDIATIVTLVQSLALSEEGATFDADWGSNSAPIHSRSW